MGEIPGFWAGAARFGRAVPLGREARLHGGFSALVERGEGWLVGLGMRREVARAWVSHAPVATRGEALVLGDPRYPERLTELDFPPPFLCVEGDVAALAHARTSVIGTRACTARGAAIAWSLGAALADTGDVVVSGLARGIDGAAHRGALTTGRTVAVVAHGLSFTAPPSHRRLRAEIAAAGAVVSPFFDDLEPRPHTFPMRNPVVAGIVSSVIVVEAPERSGALITARAAADFSRDVFVLRGPPGASLGTAGLEIDGAIAIDSVLDLLRRRAGWPVITGLLAHLVEGESLESIAARRKLPVQELLEAVGRLEREGVVVRRPGQRYALGQGWS